ncbi:MAG: hypothetical protein Q8R18_01475 [bacterium]|nr:hypothetical protein [bacterium]
MVETVRDRLERMKNTPYGNYEPRREEPKEERFLTPESIYMKKVDKVIMQIETLRTKMHSGTDQYISLYQELKKAEEDFLALLQNPEDKFMDLPTAFSSRVESVKKKLLTKKF